MKICTYICIYTYVHIYKHRHFAFWIKEPTFLKRFKMKLVEKINKKCMVGINLHNGEKVTHISIEELSY